MRFSALANSRGPAAAGSQASEVLARARQAEADGFDVVGFADMAIGDPFPALAVMATQTERIALMSRVAGVFLRSAPSLASAAAWVDALSGGRFTLGLGASSRRVVESRHGLAFERPAERMVDAVRLIRALYGDETAGASPGDGGLAFDGATLAVERAALDLAPARRVPIVIAASGPRMLRVAGAWCDGVIVELASPRFVAWAWARIEEGAAAVGRQLPPDFTFLYQSQLAPESDDPASRKRRDQQIDFLVGHMLQPEFDHMWKGGGTWEVALAVRAAVAAGDRAAADRLVAAEVHPAMAVTAPVAGMADALITSIEAMHAAGVTVYTLPLEFEAVAGIGLSELRRRLAARPTDPGGPS
jgi:alkanesulfonate monooxygenase SsuD/methylene tetrahydromethanopterin reductase-like flavin-dependent oxidoreductase (luciferase family)